MTQCKIEAENFISYRGTTSSRIMKMGRSKYGPGPLLILLALPLIILFALGDAIQTKIKKSRKKQPTNNTT
jgi:hypothetical protein